MATFVYRVQFLDDTDPFNSTNFPEPTRPPVYSFRGDIPLIIQIAGVHRLVKAPHKIDDCTLQLSHNSTYLDLESTLVEQRKKLEGFQEDSGRGKKNSIIIRTKLSVRVHTCIEKLYNSDGRELRRALFSLKQIFQDDKDLVHEFVIAEGLTCLIKVGAEADQNYQNYILRALGQIMLYVDGINGIINHNETIQWLYTLIGSKFRLVVKTALKLLLVLVEYTESNSQLLIQAVTTSDKKREVKPWSNIMEILKEKDGVDTELLVYVMTLINKTLAGLPDQDSFYDMLDSLEELDMENISSRHLHRKGTDSDLVEQFNIYEITLKHEDSDENVLPLLNVHKERRASLCSHDSHGLVRRKSRRHSLQNAKSLSPLHARLSSYSSPIFLSTHGHHTEDLSQRLRPYAAPKSCYGTSMLPHQETQHDRPYLGGLLTSSHRQHQESLAAERERRRQEREERLQRIEREERNKFNRDYLDKREEHRHAREERYKNIEKLAAEEYEKELKSRSTCNGKSLLSLDLCFSEATSAVTKCTNSASVECYCDIETHSIINRSHPFIVSPSYSDTKNEQEAIMENNMECKAETEEEQQLETDEKVQPIDGGEIEQDHGQYSEDSTLSEKEKHSKEANEKDNCSASSISSASSTLEREEKEEKITSENEMGSWSHNTKDDEPCDTLLSNKICILDMLYVHNKESRDEDEETEEDDEENKGKVENDKLIYNLSNRISVLQASKLDENIKNIDDEKIENLCSVQAFKEKFNSGEFNRTTNNYEGNISEKMSEKTVQPRRESDYIWDQLMANPRELKIKDLDFTDLEDDYDIDVLNVDLDSKESVITPPPPPCYMGFLPPPPPPLSGGFQLHASTILPPPLPFTNTQSLGSPQLPRNEPVVIKKKKTIRLFWNEVRPFELQSFHHKRSKDLMWSKLEPIKLDTSKLEYLFESKSKELPTAKGPVTLCNCYRSESASTLWCHRMPGTEKKTAADGKRQEITVLDSKRSNAINIGLTVLPPPRTIKMAILNFDEYALNKEGIDKILTMIPTEEEKQKIQDAQLTNPDVPLGSAEQFLLTLSSISELSARLQLWAFKMDYELVEKEIAEPLFDLKEGMDQLENNKTLVYVISTLLAIGNFLNGTNAKAFDLSYLQKVPEVKDTVHKQSLIYHLCTVVVEKFPDSTDLYSEIGAITRSAKVDFDQLQDNLCNLERRCKASWDYLKIIANYEMKSSLKQKMRGFLKDCAERIIILKIVHRRIINRFCSFLLFMGHPSHAIHEVKIHKFCKIIGEFALEYRTSRDRVLQQKQKWANHKERNKSRGKIITDTEDEDEVESGSFANNSNAKQICIQSHSQSYQGLKYAEDAAEHENMKAMLKTSSINEEGTTDLGAWSRTRNNRGRIGLSSVGRDDSFNVTDNAADEIMDHIVKSAIQVPNQRVLPRERKRSRANRKSLRRTLKSGLTPEEAKSLGLVSTSEMQI